MRAAFDAGADIVEFDVHQTMDGTFAVFHDWMLECRTNGHGEVRDQTLAELRKLDIGYGYTADGGKTYPADRLRRFPASRLKNITVYGGANPVAEVKERLPGMGVASMATMARCLGRYAAVGWSGYVPAPAKGLNCTYQSGSVPTCGAGPTGSCTGWPTTTRG